MMCTRTYIHIRILTGIYSTRIKLMCTAVVVVQYENNNCRSKSRTESLAVSQRKSGWDTFYIPCQAYSLVGTHTCFGRSETIQKKRRKEEVYSLRAQNDLKERGRSASQETPGIHLRYASQVLQNTIPMHITRQLLALLHNSKQLHYTINSPLCDEPYNVLQKYDNFLGKSIPP